MTDSRALKIANEAVAKDLRGIAGVAERLGISRTALSLYLRGIYPANAERLERKILGLVNEVDCPALAQTVSRLVCENYAALTEPPTHNPMRHQHWQTCQICPHKPGGGAANGNL